MKQPIPSRDAIVQLARSIAKQYVSARESRLSAGDAIDSASDWIVAIESEFKSILKKEMSKVDTGIDSDDVASTQAGSDDDPSDFEAEGFPEATLDIALTADEHEARSPGTTVRSGKKASSSTLDMPPGYRISSILGKGGMGVVYKAWHQPLRRTVAMKMILSGTHASEKQRSRFQAEAEAAAKLSHPNIVSIYEVGQHNGLPYFSLEFIDGDSLSKTLRESTLSSDRAVELMRQICDAVHHSHQQGIIHRDLKPQNIMLTSGGIPKVTDFGLAKSLSGEGEEQTQSGEILGTPGYMSPEQARGSRDVGPSCDVYALGAILYYLLTGRAPFVGPTPMETVRQVLSDEPLSPSKLQPKLNRDLETICLKCLEKEPQKRYETAQDLSDELTRFIHGQPIHARRVTAAERAWKWCKRNPRVASLSGIAATLMLVLLCGGYVAAGVINQQKIAEQDARHTAEENEKIAKENEALAEDQADLALNATRLVLYETQKFFKYRPQLNELRENMLNEMLADIERIYASNEQFDVKEIFRASTLRQIGQIFFEGGAYEQALEKFLESERIAIDLHQQGRLSRPNLNFATMHMWIGKTKMELKDLQEAEQRFRKVIEYRKQYFADHPSIDAGAAEQSMAEANGLLGEAYRRQNKFDQARPLMQMAVDTRLKWHQKSPRDLKSSEELAGALGALSGLYESSGQHAKMIPPSEQAVELLKRSAANKSDLPTHHNLGTFLRRLGRQRIIIQQLPEAQQAIEASIDSFESALKFNPADYEAQTRLVDSYYLLAALQVRNNDGTNEHSQRGLELCEQLLSRSRSSYHLLMKMKLVAALGKVEEAVAIADQLAGKHVRPDHCLFSAIGYALSSEHCPSPQQEQLLEKAMACVRHAVIDHKFDEFLVLRHDPDFYPLQALPEYQQLLEEQQRLTDNQDDE